MKLGNWKLNKALLICIRSRIKKGGRESKRIRGRAKRGNERKVREKFVKLHNELLLLSPSSKLTAANEKWFFFIFSYPYHASPINYHPSHQHPQVKKKYTNTKKKWQWVENTGGWSLHLDIDNRMSTIQDRNQVVSIFEFKEE